MLGDLFAKIDAGEARFYADGGFARQLVDTGLQRGPQTELTEYVGYGKGDAEASLHPHSRNGSFVKTAGTAAVRSSCRYGGPMCSSSSSGRRVDEE